MDCPPSKVWQNYSASVFCLLSSNSFHNSLCITMLRNRRLASFSSLESLFLSCSAPPWRRECSCSTSLLAALRLSDFALKCLSYPCNPCDPWLESRLRVSHLAKAVAGGEDGMQFGRLTMDRAFLSPPVWKCSWIGRARLTRLDFCVLISEPSPHN